MEKKSDFDIYNVHKLKGPALPWIKKCCNKKNMRLRKTKFHIEITEI